VDFTGSTPGLTSTSDESLHVQHQLHIGSIGFRDQSRLGKVPLLLGFLLGQDVTFEGVLPLELTSARLLKSLFGTRNAFHLRHLTALLFVLISSSSAQ
jgi:hypothetical protein